eukprot:CAMPEP_0118682814 /NCGR_PEP_ID=MMETSP0800-20121206/5686_1 /TAXON_ID=210618 ORGANISM="Striatella unipunctata, Strain CCMP2910" /NCGR_SAMPLE_ID=MMETSP0800 /ASSEMBLY_ACC=CAM_ASM_000638 /LENGTH=293 /DNA_ID=CAMNT_0006579229 /DNA_START=233 /DNA_END=1114 /DNA_ORIENTATION=+
MEDTREKLQKYLHWRKLHALDETPNSTVCSRGPAIPKGLTENEKEEYVHEQENLWNHACKKAAKIFNETKSAKKGKSATNVSSLPRMARFYNEKDRPTFFQDDTQQSTDRDEIHCGCNPNELDHKHHCKHATTKNNSRIVHVLPAQLDFKRAPPEIYVLALGIYMDMQLCRSNLEQVTLLVDVRGGEGWPNPTPQQVLPFFKALTQVFGAHFPERLQKCVIYPMPKVMMWMWHFLFKHCLDPITASKIVMVHGPALTDTPLTAFFKNGLQKHVDIDTMLFLEKERVDAFYGKN